MADQCNAHAFELAGAAEKVGQGGKGRAEAASKLLHQFVGMKEADAFKLIHEISGCSGHQLPGGGTGGSGGRSEGLEYVGDKGTLHVPALNVDYKNGIQTVTVGDPRHPLAKQTTTIK